MTDTTVTKNESGPLKPENAASAGEAKTAPKAKKKTAEKKEPRMYVGPTVPGIGIQNRVYTEIPKEAQEQAEKTPEIALLFVPVKDYPMANRMLRESAGYIYDAYCKAEEMKKGGDGHE